MDPYLEARFRAAAKGDRFDWDLFDDEADGFTRAVWYYRRNVCQTSDSDKEVLTNLKEALENTLYVTDENDKSSPNNPSFYTESSFSSENIHVNVKGIGDLKFPLDPKVVEDLSLISSKAKFGKGSETVLDLKVRNTQMIPESELKVSIDDAAYSTLLKLITEGLNIDPNLAVVPHLYNLLIYGPGQFFQRHTDTEKVENMIATLVLILPSFYKGGELVIKHGRKEFSFNQAENPNEIKWVAFYPDCQHWIKEVTDGFRVVLTFNVEMKLPVPEACNTFISNGINDKLNKCVSKFFDRANHPKKLIYLLNHSYSENSLKWQLLKGKDKIQGHALYAVAKNQNLVPCLALVVDEEFKVDNPVSHEFKFMSTIKVRYVVGKDNEVLLEQPSYPLEFVYDKEICYTIRSMWLLEEFEYHKEGFSGNEPSKRESRYHRACILLCDQSLISSATINGKLKMLTNAIVEAGEELHTATGPDSDDIKTKKIFVEGSLPPSEVVLSIPNEGILSYPPSTAAVKKLIQMSQGEKRREPHALAPKKSKIEIKSKVWDDLISSISMELGLNPKCKLTPNFRGIRLYDDLHDIIGLTGVTPWWCDYRSSKCIGCYNLAHNDFCNGLLKSERGDITLVLIFPGVTQGKLSIKYATESYTISDLDKLESIKYIACYSDCDIEIHNRKGTFLYLLYNLEIQSDSNEHVEIDTSFVHHPLSNAVEKYFADDIQPRKLIFLLNHDYSKNKLKWHMLKGADNIVAHALYTVAKHLGLVPYLAYTHVREHWSEAFSKSVEERTITETHFDLLFLVDEKNKEVEPSSYLFQTVIVGEVCFTMPNKVQSKPFQIDEVSLTESIRHYNRACVTLCVPHNL